MNRGDTDLNAETFIRLHTELRATKTREALDAFTRRVWKTYRDSERLGRLKGMVLERRDELARPRRWGLR